jgi:N-acyl homoserine lactone hydrolase
MCNETEMRVHIISLGTLFMPMNMLYGNEYENTILPDVPVYGVLLEHPDGLVLFDTGCITEDGYDKYKSYFKCTNEDLLVNRLSEIGYTPGDIKYVVLSHLHFDHSGNVHLFKNAKILVSSEEFSKTMLDYGLGRETAVDPKEVELWVKNSLKWKLIEEDKRELLPGITIYNFGSGHSYGMLAMLIHTQTLGKVLIVGDMAYTREALKLKVPGAVFDEKGYLDSIVKINEMEKKENLKIWCGHDIEQFATLKKAPEGFYK